MYDTEDFHQMIASFFTHLLFPPQRTDNDWWEVTIERGLLSYFDLSSSLTDARSFLRGNQRQQYICTPVHTVPIPPIAHSAPPQGCYSSVCKS